MRVVVLTQWFPPENAWIPQALAERLVRSGHDVTILTGFPNYPAGEIYAGWRQAPRSVTREHGYRLVRVALYPSHDRSPVRRALNYLSFSASATISGWTILRAADVVYVYHPPLTAVTGAWLSRVLGGAPFVLHVQDLWPDSVISAGLLSGRAALRARALLSRACDAVYGRAAAVVAIAPTMARTLTERGVPADRTHVVSNWADERHFRPEARSESAVAELGASDSFTVMFAGNLGDFQALDVAIRAAARVQDLPDFKLIIVGSGVAEQGLRTLVGDLGLRNVVFLGRRSMDSMSRLTAAADVHLVSLRALPFFEGTIPGKLASLLACGLPVICAIGGDAARVVTAAGCGWTSPPEDLDALELTFRKAHSSTRKQRLDLGRAGRAYYEQHMSQAAGVAALTSILVAAGAPRSRLATHE